MPRHNNLRVTRRHETITAKVAGNPGRTAERLLLGVPTCTAIAFGLFVMVGRFIAVLRENFKEAPDNLASIMLLVVMIGGVSALVVLACTGAGFTIGVILRSFFAKRLTMALSEVLSRHSRAPAG